jgi:hypothetical protein
MFDGQLLFPYNTERADLRGQPLLSRLAVRFQLTHLIIDEELGMEKWFRCICTVRVSSSCSHDRWDGFRMRYQEISEEGSRRGSL